MSRRPLGPGSQPSPQARMAPGGRLWSESPLPRFAIRKVRTVGVEPEGIPANVLTARPSDFVVEWDYNIPTAGLTAACVVRVVFTLTAVDATINWFEMDAGGFTSGARVQIPFDRHYVYYDPGLTTSRDVSGNREVTVTSPGATFAVGDVVDVTFPSDGLYRDYPNPGSGELYIPPLFATDSATLYIVTP